MKKEILKAAFKPLTWVNKFIKKDEKLIFFYSNLGFRDNVKAFYDYLIGQRYNERYHFVVSINDAKDYITNAPDNVTFVGNRQGIKYFIKAKYAFYCFGKYPIKPSKKQIVVNLWHGTPLKKIGNLERGLEKTDYNFFTMVVASSPLYKPIMAKIFGCDESQVIITGNPRNDELFVKDEKVDAAIRGDAQKVILWLPTYREYDEEYVVSILKKSQLEQLNEKLKENHCKMIVKLHPLQTVSVRGLDYSQIEFASQKDLNKKEISVYTLLRNADALITDYSSVYFDYMLLNRPIAFTVEDIEEYKKKRGFVFDNPYEYMPGMKLSDYDDLEQYIMDVINGKDSFASEREKVNMIINSYNDGNSSRRVEEKVFGRHEL